MRAGVQDDLHGLAEHVGIHIPHHRFDQRRRSGFVVLAAGHVHRVMEQHRQRLRRAQREAPGVRHLEHLEHMGAVVVAAIGRLIERQRLEHGLARQEVQTGQRGRPVRREAGHLARVGPHRLGEDFRRAHPQDRAVAHGLVDHHGRQVGLEAAQAGHTVGAALVVAVGHARHEVRVVRHRHRHRKGIRQDIDSTVAADHKL
ncbi:hypothetical protein D3C72_1013520 [compost metagenome]